LRTDTGSLRNRDMRRSISLGRGISIEPLTPRV
jgi:hypothetical protein